MLGVLGGAGGIVPMPSTSEEAVETILLHTASVEQLLRRRGMRKEFLVSYLHAHGAWGVVGGASKGELIDTILTLWG